MRFAYIDSNDNEVPIPSVDALALRIELGAITDDTQLYDAAADQWAPANSHEIYHTLQRSAGEDEGFVAPPPVAAAPVVATPDLAIEDEPLAVEETPGPEELGSVAEGGEDLGDMSGLTLADTSTESEGGSLPDLDLDLAPAEAEGEGLTLAVDDSLAGGDDLGFETIDLAPAQAGGDPDEPDLQPAEDDPAEDGEALGFDFGGMEGGLELEQPTESEDEPSMGFSGGGLDTGAPDLGPGGDFGPGSDEPVPDFSGGMELETAIDFGAGGFDTDSDGGLDLEAPMSEFSPDEPPSWMEGEDAKDGDVLDFSASAPTSEAGDESGRDRRTPKSRPSPPKHRKQRNLAAPLVGVVVLLAVGVGGYAAWPILSERLDALGEPETSEVMVPDLAPELMAEMQSAADAALATSFYNVVSAWNAQARVDAPGTDWPGGSYMASASQYGTVEDFWNDMSDLLEVARDISVVDFDAALSAELSARGMSGADALAIRERADSGYVAAAPARQVTWDRFAAVVDASLAMHRFVLANEAEIEYVPASTATTNPVLEIDAATPEISAALEDMLGAVVDALADLGYRRLVSSEGLRGHLLTELQASGIQ